MTKDEALRLALEALEDIGDEWGFTSQRTVPKRKKAITCLRLVIDAENISSKPMAWEQFYPEMGKPKLVEVQDGECKRCTDGCPACDARKLPEREIATAVLEHCYSPMAVTSDMIDRTTEVIKAKLKEKNT
jgi:hypothetical protein